MITKLSAAQEALLPQLRDKWLDLCLGCRAGDHAMAEQGVRDAYVEAGLPPPRFFVWMPNPFHSSLAVGVIAAQWSDIARQVSDQVSDQVDAQVDAQVNAQVSAQVSDQVREVYDQVSDQVSAQVYDQVRDQVDDQVSDQVDAQVRDQVDDQVDAQVDAQVYAQVRDQVDDQVYSQVSAQVNAQVRAQVNAQVRAQVRDRVDDQVYSQVRDQVDAQVNAQVNAQVYAATRQRLYSRLWGSMSGWPSYYDAMHQIGVAECKRMEPRFTVARHAGWWWPMRGICVLTERHSTLHRDEQHRLHNITGPAISWPDGYGVYCVGGVLVPADWVEGRDKLDPKRALTEANAEHRRAITQIVGWDRVLEHAPMHEVGSDAYGKLMRVELDDDDDEKALFVQLACTTTGRVYHFRVPPDCTTPRHALGWKYHPERPESGRDVSPTWYRPGVET